MHLNDPWNFKYYKYDVRGRVIKMWNIISGFDTLVTLYNYNSQDQITNYSHIRQGIKVSYNNIYDYSGRLSKVEKLTLPDNPNTDFINLSEYEYNENSLISQQQLNDGSVTNLYFYNNRNWIAEMIQYEGYFAYLNGYFKNGNVKTQQLSGSYNENFEVDFDLNYNYSYDKSNRLLYSKTSDTILQTENSYDKDGNILTLERTNGIGGIIDNFNYNYYSGTNKLKYVTGSGNQFTYDSNGNLITDALNNNESMYDHRNLITALKHKSQIIGDPIYITKYYYDESGNRMRKMTYLYIDTLNGREPPVNSDVSDKTKWELQNDEIYSRDVSGKELAIYKNNEIPEYPIYGSDMIGKIRDDDVYVYMKDHLGSVRAVLKDYNIVSAQDYDAWGYIYGERSYESSESKFKFTGKERDAESEYDYFGARYYDARIGRWGQIDPLQDKEPSKTPYHYTSNNPISFVDPFGLTDYYYKDGEEIDRQPGEYAWMYRFGFKTDIFDRYYVQDPSGNVEYNGSKYFQGATKESVLPIDQQQIQWSKIYADWETTGFASNVNSVLELYQIVKGDYNSVVDFALQQSGEEGDMDRKHHLINYNDPYSAQSYLYIYKGFAFNWRQAGNIVWGASMNSLGFNYKGIFTGAQFYSLFKHQSSDQPDEVYSFTVGYYRSTSPWRHLGQ